MRYAHSKELPHPAAPDADQQYNGGVVNEKNWVDFATECYVSSNDFLNYLDGINHMTSQVEIMLESADKQTFEEFKNHLREFCSDRRGFIQHIKEMPSPNDVWH